MKADLEKEFPEIKVKLVKSGGGVFEVERDGELIFSKKETGRFPEFEEILKKMQ